MWIQVMEAQPWEKEKEKEKGIFGPSGDFGGTLVFLILPSFAFWQEKEIIFPGCSSRNHAFYARFHGEQGKSLKLSSMLLPSRFLCTT